jgi:hypothetical protein
VIDKEADIQSLKICSRCLEDKNLSSVIRKNGTRGKCDFSDEHGSRCNALEIKEFCKYFDDYFRDQYCLETGYLYEKGYGDPPLCQYK